MPAIDFVVETEVSRSTRARQLEALFDVPPAERSRIHFTGAMPIEERPWSIGAIIGPSGSGKSTILDRVFGRPEQLEWSGKAVIDDFPANISVSDIGAVCQSVGFNTIPAWLRPFRVLSNGERFRVDMARRLVEKECIILDEFTSVVDRQVAKVGCHAFQKYVRKHNKTAVVAACHYDIEDWLQPDWIFEPGTMTLRWRALRERPAITCEIRRVDRREWSRFAPFHYMSADINNSCRCFCLFVDGVAAAFAATIYRPHPNAKNIYGISRLVCLPDYQGLGLAHYLKDKLAAMYADIGMRLRGYPAHPALVRSFGGRGWVCVKLPGMSSTSKKSPTSTVGRHGGRQNAVFEYRGPGYGDRQFSQSFISGR